MKPKTICRVAIDLVMTILLLLLMAREITGDSAHEWLGAGIFVLWIVHHVLNYKWYRDLFRGKYTLVRGVRTGVNFLLLLAMLGTMVSAVILSREVFAFLPITGGIALARSMHILCTFWSFILMAIHLGLHWNWVLGMLRKSVGPVSSKAANTAIRVVGVAVAVCGLYAFLKHRLLSYMFLTESFVFFDYEQPQLLFFAEYVAIMGLFVCLAHYAGKGLQWVGQKRQIKNLPKRKENG